MIFVDTSVVMYAVGRPHPFRDPARERLMDVASGTLATSAEVMQELVHAYLPVGRVDSLDDALQLVRDRMIVWPVTEQVVQSARDLIDRHPALTARDLVHLATCHANPVTELWSYDRGLASAFRS